jgi:CubicO group peptidase (beta-lactamase class C family)
VSKREPAAVRAELEVDDLALLRHLAETIDTHARSVTASAFDVVRRQAVYRDGLGCALVLDGLTPPQSASNAAVVAPAIPQGMRGEALEAAIDRAFTEPDPARPKRTQAVVIVHRGQIVGERYVAGFGSDTPLNGWSMTKSVVNALAGILVKEGLLTLQAPVPIQDWRGPGDLRSSITLDNLLRMKSGLRFEEDMSNPRADVMRMLLGAGDAAKFAMSKDVIDAPGTVFRYSSGTTTIISRVMRNALRDDTEYWSFPRRALFDRIGMASAILETDAAGTFVGSSFMYASARDWARFGMLYSQDGVWNANACFPRAG